MKRVMWLFVFLVFVELVFAGVVVSSSDNVSGVGSLNTNTSGSNLVSNNYGQNNVPASTYSPKERSKEYTSDFYIALFLGILALFIVAVFTYLFLREPKNRWHEKTIKTTEPGKISFMDKILSIFKTSHKDKPVSKAKVVNNVSTTGRVKLVDE